MLCVVALVVLVIALVVWAAIQQDAYTKEEKEDARAREAGLWVDDSLTEGLGNAAVPYVAGLCFCSVVSGIVAYMAARSRGANDMTAVNAGAGVVVTVMCLCLCSCVAFKINMDMEYEKSKTQPYYMMGEDGGVVMVTPTPSAAS